MKTLRILSYFTGSTGVYASVLPTSATLDALRRVNELVQATGVQTQPLVDQHVTVLYSKDIVSSATADRLLGNGMGPDRVYRARPVTADIWAGHDASGYLVLMLDSPDLAELNDRVRKLTGARGTFDDYRPHLTLAKNTAALNPSAVEEARYAVATSLDGTEWQFTGFRVEDLA